MLETTETLHSKHVAYYMCHKKKKLEKIFTFDFYFRNSVWNVSRNDERKIHKFDLYDLFLPPISFL